MHDRGIKVTPFLSNHWARQKGRNAVNNAEALSDQIVNTINEYELDGVFAFNDELVCKVLNTHDHPRFKIVGYDGLSKNTGQKDSSCHR